MTIAPEILVDSFAVNTTVGSQTKLVTLSDGSLLVAYVTRAASGPGFEIRGQLIDSDGSAIGGELVFSFARTIDDRRFDITATADNHVAIVAEVDDGDTQIDTRLFEVTPSGVTLADAGTSHPESNSTLVNPAITSSGDFDDFRYLFVDIDEAPDIEFFGLEDGNGFFPNADIEVSGNALEDTNIAVTTLENGNIAALVDVGGSSVNFQGFHLFIYNTEGDVQETDFIFTSVDMFNPAITALKGGGFVVSYAEENSDIDVMYAVFDANGNQLRAPQEFGIDDTPEAGNNNEPAIVALDDGGFAIFYDKDAGTPEVRGQRFDAEGNPIGEDFQVFAGNGLHLSATLLEDGRVAVGYTVFRTGRVEVTVLEFESIIGTDGDDTLVGTDGNDFILGRAGDDTLSGEEGDDVLRGEDGADTLNGGVGADHLAGGTGADRLNGNAGDDEIDGGDGDDTIDGGIGFDIISGGDGDDIVNGGDGRDTVNLGDGDDTYTDSTQAGVNGRDTVNGGAGDDSINGGGGNDRLNGDQGNDVLRGANGFDTVNGNAGDDTLFGGNGNDVLTGGSGGDILNGGAGNDVLNGDFNPDVAIAAGGVGIGLPPPPSNDDVLNGGAGNDVLNGQSGDDVLTGGAGNDVFVFANGFARDRIEDFEANNDLEVIDLSAVTAIVNFNDLVNNHMEQVGTDVVIDAGDGNVLTIVETDIADLNIDDFLFV